MTDRTCVGLGFGVLCARGAGMALNAFAEKMSWPWLLTCGWVVFGGAAALLGFASVREAWKEWKQFRMDLWRTRQHALSETPAVRIAEALRGLHPEAVRVLNKFGVRTQWQVKIDANNNGRDWILLGTNVHFGFVEFVLNHSSDTSLYPKRMFSEGSSQYDPDGLTSDYEQYDELMGWMQSRLMVTSPFGNQAAQFLPPWSPDLVLEVM